MNFVFCNGCLPRFLSILADNTEKVKTRVVASYGTSYVSSKDDYISSLKTVASMQGLQPTVVEELLREGYAPEDVEDYIYEYQYYG